MPAKCNTPRPTTRCTAARASPLSRPNPNFESSVPVSMYSWVCASTPGVTRTCTCGAGLGRRFVVAVEHDAIGREAGRQRDVELAAGGDVEVQALLVHEPRHRE